MLYFLAYFPYLPISVLFCFPVDFVSLFWHGISLQKSCVMRTLMKMHAVTGSLKILDVEFEPTADTFFQNQMMTKSLIISSMSFLTNSTKSTSSRMRLQSTCIPVPYYKKNHCREQSGSICLQRNGNRLLMYRNFLEDQIVEASPMNAILEAQDRQPSEKPVAWWCSCTVIIAEWNLKVERRGNFFGAKAHPAVAC